MLSVGSTFAQDLIIDEIIVTATKRPESMQDVPITVSAFTGDAIEEAGVKDIRDIAGQTPGLSIKSRGDTEASVFIRGIGSQAPGIGADPAVGIYIDGVYVARATSATAAFFDVERVEVVKGPQGTLFGRNASAGAISIITNKPDIGENYAAALLGFGNEGQQKYEFVYNAGVSDTVAFRIGAKQDRRDGLYRNSLNGDELNGRENTNVRAALRYKGSGSWASDFSYEYIESSSKAAFVSDPNFFADKLPLQDVPADQDLESSRLIWANSWELRDNLILTSITGYYDLDVNVTPVDADTLDVPLLTFEEPQTANFLSQEFRLNGSSNAIDWFVGGSYIEEDLTFRNNLVVDEFIAAALLGLNELDVGDMDACDGGIDFDGTVDVALPVCLTPATETPSGENKTTSYAVYGDFTWHLNDTVNLSAGVRYTNDKKDMTYNNPGTGGLLDGLAAQLFGLVTPGPVNDTVEFSSTDPRLALGWNVSDGTMVYASGAKGYKSGGLNRTYDDVSGTILPFDKEESTAYELGIKSSGWDGRGQINAAVFKNDYKNYQLEVITNLVPQVRNIGNAEVNGFEIDFRFLLSEKFEVNGSYAILDAELKEASDPANQGNKMPQAPESSGHLSGKFSVPARNGNFDIIATWMYTDSFFFDLANVHEQSSFSTVDARVAWSNDTWGLALAGENLTDEEYLSEVFDFLLPTGIRAPGRLVRLEATLNF